MSVRVTNWGASQGSIGMGEATLGAPQICSNSKGNVPLPPPPTHTAAAETGTRDSVLRTTRASLLGCPSLTHLGREAAGLLSSPPGPPEGEGAGAGVRASDQRCRPPFSQDWHVITD